MINIAELYKPKTDNKVLKIDPKKIKFKTPQKQRPVIIEAKQRQEQIKRNNEQINKIIRSKKFYLKHKPIFDTVEEDQKEMNTTSFEKNHEYDDSEQLQESNMVPGYYMSKRGLSLPYIDNKTLASESVSPQKDVFKSGRNSIPVSKNGVIDLRQLKDLNISDLDYISRNPTKMTSPKQSSISVTTPKNNQMTPFGAEQGFSNKLRNLEKSRQHHSKTKEIIHQAVKVLDGEKAYNDANLDQYLMGIKKIKVQKKNLPKLLPNLTGEKLSKADENFYQQYSAINETISSQKIGNEDIGNVIMSPMTPYKQIKDVASPGRKKSLQKRQDSNIVLDYALNGDIDNKKYYYRQQSNYEESEQKQVQLKIDNRVPMNRDLPESPVRSPNGHKQSLLMRKLQSYKQDDKNLKIMVFNFDSLKKINVNSPKQIQKSERNLQADPKFEHQQIYGESIRQETVGTPTTEKQEIGDEFTTSNAQPKRGFNKYFDNVTDLYDIDDEYQHTNNTRERNMSKSQSDDSDNENEPRSNASRGINGLAIGRQISTIVDWNGAIKNQKENRKNKNNYIIEQWDEESELTDKHNPANAVGIEVFAKDIDIPPALDNLSHSSSLSDKNNNI